LKAKEADLKKHYDEFVAIMNDPEKADALRQKLVDSQRSKVLDRILGEIGL
jgi:hypothetical protein